MYFYYVYILSTSFGFVLDHMPIIIISGLPCYVRYIKIFWPLIQYSSVNMNTPAVGTKNQ
jgi:hypothetical protein